MITKILLRISKRRKNKTKPHIDSSKLKDETVKQALSFELTNQFNALDCDSLSLGDKWGSFKTVMSATAGKLLGSTNAKRQNWISAKNSFLSLAKEDSDRPCRSNQRQS